MKKSIEYLFKEKHLSNLLDSVRIYSDIFGKIFSQEIEKERQSSSLLKSTYVETRPLMAL